MRKIYRCDEGRSCLGCVGRNKCDKYRLVPDSSNVRSNPVNIRTSATKEPARNHLKTILVSGKIMMDMM